MNSRGSAIGSSRGSVESSIRGSGEGSVRGSVRMERYDKGSRWRSRGR